MAQSTSWSVALSIPNVQSMDIDCADSLDCVVLVNGGLSQHIFRSSDGGVTWGVMYADSGDSQSNRLPLSLFKIQHPSRGSCVVAADSGLLLVWNATSNTWSRKEVAESHNWGYKLSMYDSSSGIIQFTGFGVPMYRTEDGGNTWQPMRIDRPPGWDSLPALCGDLVCASRESYFATIRGPDNVAIARTLNGGSEWQIKYPALDDRDTFVVGGTSISVVDSNTVFLNTSRNEGSATIGRSILLQTNTAGND